MRRPPIRRSPASETTSLVRTYNVAAVPGQCDALARDGRDLQRSAPDYELQLPYQANVKPCGGKLGLAATPSRHNYNSFVLLSLSGEG